MTHVVFQDARGIICRGGSEHPYLAAGALVTVRTHTPFVERTARVEVRPADGFVRLGELRGLDGSHDWLLEWLPEEPVVIAGRPLVEFGRAA